VNWVLCPGTLSIAKPVLPGLVVEERMRFCTSMLSVSKSTWLASSAASALSK
jgi:hypothetical protein